MPATKATMRCLAFWPARLPTRPKERRQRRQSKLRNKSRIERFKICTPFLLRNVILLEERPDRGKRPHPLVGFEIAVPATGDGHQLIRHSGAGERIAQTRGVRVRDD